MTFPIHTIATAPAGSRETLQYVQKTIGLIPNLAAAMSESPALVRGFFSLRDIFGSASGFSNGEQQVLYLTNAIENGCDYCVALHSAMALKAEVPRAEVEALRKGALPSEPRLNALSGLSRIMIQKRGNISNQDLEQFYSEGFGPAHALEVVLGIAVSTMANYSHHIVQCPLDTIFEAHEWKASKTGSHN